MTILEALENALVALMACGFKPGGAVYDDLEQAIRDLKAGLLLSDELTA